MAVAVAVAGSLICSVRSSGFFAVNRAFYHQSSTACRSRAEEVDVGFPTARICFRRDESRDGEMLRRIFLTNASEVNEKRLDGNDDRWSTRKARGDGHGQAHLPLMYFLKPYMFNCR